MGENYYIKIRVPHVQVKNQEKYPGKDVRIRSFV